MFQFQRIPYYVRYMDDDLNTFYVSVPVFRLCLLILVFYLLNTFYVSVPGKYADTLRWCSTNLNTFYVSVPVPPLHVPIYLSYFTSFGLSSFSAFLSNLLKKNKKRIKIILNPIVTHLSKLFCKIPPGKTSLYDTSHLILSYNLSRKIIPQILFFNLAVSVFLQTTTIVVIRIHCRRQFPANTLPPAQVTLQVNVLSLCIPYSAQMGSISAIFTDSSRTSPFATSISNLFRL